MPPLCLTPPQVKTIHSSRFTSSFAVKQRKRIIIQVKSSTLSQNALCQEFIRAQGFFFSTHLKGKEVK